MEKIEGVITELAASQLYDSQVYTDNDPKSVSQSKLSSCEKLLQATENETERRKLDLDHYEFEIAKIKSEKSTKLESNKMPNLVLNDVSQAFNLVGIQEKMA